MKAVIFAGGLGTRLAEEPRKPKPMVEIEGDQSSGIFLKFLAPMELVNSSSAVVIKAM